jgi:phosphoglycerate dehydrogenase-like enzyme
MRPIYRSIKNSQALRPVIDGTIRPKGLCVMADDCLDLIYGPDELARIERMVQIIAPPQTPEGIRELPEVLAEAEVIISGWGGPVLDEDFLDAAPNLRAIFYGGGAVSPIVTPATWERNVLVTSAYAANAIPVAEYTIAVILFSLKHGWQLSRTIRNNPRFRPPFDTPGCYERTVGLVSMGMVARTLLKHLALCDLRVLAYDPLLDPAEAEQLGIGLVSLDDLFSQSDVVSVHTPLFPETRGMITGEHIRSMKPGATFINTARGQVICEEQMLDALQERSDLQAVLDVCCEEPPVAKSRLYSLANIVLTPHLAGSVGTECRRMGRFMVDELERYITGQPLLGQVTPELARHSTHRPERMNISAVSLAPVK